MAPPDSIDAVIAELDALIAQAREQASPAGYFPALYRRVTVAVKEALARGEFEDNARMERLDIIFARRYLEAVSAHARGDAPTRSWDAAFAQHANPALIVLQHLLLGMNAHISLDLGVAAAQTANPAEIKALKTDFYKINDILASLLEDTQQRLTRVFPLLGPVDRLLGPIDEGLSIFSIGYARDKAWTQALELSLTPEADWDAAIKDRDEAVAAFARDLVSPPRRTARLLLFLVRWLERGDVRWRLDCLALEPATRS
jgi:hypothetical protein